MSPVLSQPVLTSPMQGGQPSIPHAPGLPMVRLVVLGVVLWSIGVATAHVLAPHGAFGPSWSAALLVATVPLVWLTIRLSLRLAPASAGVVDVVALVCAPALVLDGLAFTWAPSLYSVVPGEQRAAAGWLLWFVGVALALAFRQASRQTGRATP